MSSSRSNPRRITPFSLSPPLDSNNPCHPHHQQAESPSLTHESSRSPSQPSLDLSRSPSVKSARLSSSILPALRLAGLAPDPRDMRSSRTRDNPKHKPILVLKLSGSSFLDTVIRDDKSKDPIYITETSGEITTIYRLDHPRDEPIKAATIQWPLHPVRIKGKSGRSVQFGHGSWRDAEDLLKAGPLGNTAIRKFNIPHYPNSLKWKLIPGNCFCCVTSAIKGPVAVLDAATLSAPPRLKIFDALIEREIARSQDNYKGVPTILLDYLVTTAFLLVTDEQEWLDRPRDARIPGSSSYTVQRWLALIHHRPAPPEPDHPTVDLSLTVPSTPPHSATIPSPGGLWETQSGVTSLSGSNGSGSGASYIGEPFTPTTPGTPFTPATSTHSALFSRSVEDAPPVPPVPGSFSSSSPFAFSAESSHIRERHKSTPQLSHSPSPSTSTTQAPTATNAPQIEGEEDFAPLPRTRHPQTLSLPANVHGASSLLSNAASLSTSAPTSPHTGTPPAGSSAASSSSRPPRRQLPTPPGPAPANSFAQPWLYPSASSPTPATTPSSSTAATTTLTPSTSAAARAARASMRGSLRTAAIPPPPPPPQHQIPLPPKLAQEQQSYAGQIGPRPRTAPELHNGNRRRHSAGEFGDCSGQGQEGEPSSIHPYAAAAQAYTISGQNTGDHDGLVGQMQGLRIPGPLHVGGHVRPPSQPAPDYDAHSFVNMPPPVPPLPPLPTQPGSSVPSGIRSPVQTGRRVLTVVNADATTMPVEDPGRCLPSDRLRTRVSYAESVYEVPPPAYDAIDFSVPPVPPSSQAPVMPPLPEVPAPLQTHPVEAGGEGQRGS